MSATSIVAAGPGRPIATVQSLVGAPPPNGAGAAADPARSLYTRCKRDTGTSAMHETLPLDQGIARLAPNLEVFLARVRPQPA